jgi:hypothetical protein
MSVHERLISSQEREGWGTGSGPRGGVLLLRSSGTATRRKPTGPITQVPRSSSRTLRHYRRIWSRSCAQGLVNRMQFWLDHLARDTPQLVPETPTIPTTFSSNT